MSSDARWKPNVCGRANHRRDSGIGHTPRADGDERVVQQPEIRDQLGGALVSAGAVSQPSAFRVDALERQLRQHQVDKLPPGFAVLLVHGVGAARARFQRGSDAAAQRRRRRLEAIRQARLPAERHELTLQQQQPVQAQILERLPRDIRRHQRMPVLIAAHPGAQTALRQLLRRRSSS